MYRRHHVRHRIIIAATMLAVTQTHRAPAVPVEVSAPQGVTVSIYDTGMAMVSEARRAALNSGEQDLLMRGLPLRMDPASASYGAAARAAPFDLLEQVWRFDLLNMQSLLRRMTGQPIVAGQGADAREGILVGGLVGDTLPVRSRDGKNLWMIPMRDVGTLTFPFGRDLLATEPELAWKVRARQEGPQNFRLAYRTEGLRWGAHYELLLAASGNEGEFAARIAIENESGGRFENARVRLLATEKGLADPVISESQPSARPALRYAYGLREPAFERSVASLAPVEIYELPRTVTLEPNTTTYIHISQSGMVPVKRVFVYDGVRFDRFQRNRRTDWNYGTESHPVVNMHVAFENLANYGLGVNFPPGLCRIYQIREDGSIDLIGEEQMPAIPAGGSGYARVGPAIGLTGSRERTGYVEVKPHHVYEESFQIRLFNSSDETASVRVVEHLYRWPDFEIIRSDTDYTATGPQTIEFDVELRTGVRRAINYTVRYTW